MAHTPFIVDLNDPKDVEAKFAEGERILSQIEAQIASLDELQREAREWRTNVEFLASKLSLSQPETVVAEDAELEIQRTPVAGSKSGEDTPLPLVIEVVNREIRKLRAIEVHAILTREGHDITPDQVRNALHYAAAKARPPIIQAAPGRGMYAPLAYREVELPSSNGHSPHLRALTIHGDMLNK